VNAPFISVVIPTRDRNDLLARCLDRLAPGAQTMPHDRYEVIVTDDSMRSAARDLVAEQYPWARWVSGARRGPAANRNTGVRAARGEWLVFTDDDCIPESGWLAAFAAAFNPDARKLEVLEGRTTCRDGFNSPRQTAPVNLTGGQLWSCNFAIRRAHFALVHGFDERYPFAHMEDADLQARLLKAGFMIHFIAAAEVDHPPRRLPWGAQLARVHESSVLHMAIHGPSRGLPRYLFQHARARLSRIARMHKSFDTVSALCSLPLELSAIALHWREWRAKAASLVGSAS